MFKTLLVSILMILPLPALAEEYFLGPHVTVINNTRLGCDADIVPKCANYSQEFRESGVELYVLFAQKYCYQANVPSCESGDIWEYVDLQKEHSLTHISGYNWEFTSNIGARAEDVNVWQDPSCSAQAIKEKTSELLNKQDAQPIFIQVDFGEDPFFPYVNVKCTVSETISPS